MKSLSGSGLRKIIKDTGKVYERQNLISEGINTKELTIKILKSSYICDTEIFRNREV
jgi:hypothetical protein